MPQFVVNEAIPECRLDTNEPDRRVMLSIKWFIAIPFSTLRSGSGSGCSLETPGGAVSPGDITAHVL